MSSQIRMLNRRPHLSTLSNPESRDVKKNTEDVVKPSVSKLHTNHLIHLVVKRLWIHTHRKVHFINPLLLLSLSKFRSKFWRNSVLVLPLFDSHTEQVFQKVKDLTFIICVTGIVLEAKSIKEHYWKPFIQTLFERKVNSFSLFFSFFLFLFHSF